MTSKQTAAAAPKKEDEPIEAEVEHVDDGSDTSALGRIKALVSMLTRFIGVKDMSQLRISLPASWLMPVGNLEWWNYNDRPDFMLDIPDPDEPLDRMLNVVRYWYSKDTKWLRSKLAKPYNSILGEQFICHWDVNAATKHQFQAVTPPTGSAASSPKPARGLLQKYPAEVTPEAPEASDSKIPLSSTTATTTDSRRVYCITEQISHHPPISGYYYYSKDKGVIVRGVDHISAIKVFPGTMNKGIYITLETRDGEEYLCTHPTASIAGILKGDLYITVSDETVISCPRTKLKAVLTYKEESFFGKPKFWTTGKIYKYNPETDPAKWKPSESDVVCTLDGCWKGKITYHKTKVSGLPSTEPQLLVDMSTLLPFEKTVTPEYEQKYPKASRVVWKEVTTNILSQDFSEATKHKRIVEDEQRQERVTRAEKGDKFQSFWFYFMDDSELGGVPKEREPQPVDKGAGLEGKPFLKSSCTDLLPWNVKE